MKTFIQKMQLLLPWLCGVLFILFLPMRDVSYPRNTFILLGLLSAYIFRKQLRSPGIPLKFPLLVILVVALGSVPGALDPYQSLLEIRREIGYSAAALTTFFMLSDRDAAWRAWFYGLVTSLLILASLRLKDLLIDGKWIDQAYFQSDPVLFSSYLLTMLPLLFAVGGDIRASRSMRSIAYVAICVAVVCGFVSLNRAFILAFAAVLCVFLTLNAIRSRFPLSQLSSGALLLAICIVASAWFVSTANRRIEMTGKNISLEQSFEGDPRLEIWQFAVAEICKHPFAGSGFGKYSARDAFVDRFNDRLVSHAHNIFLNWSLQMGIQGAIALLLLFGALFVNFWRLYRSPVEFASLAGVAGLCLLTGFIAKNMTDDVFFRQNALLFWTVSGILLGRGLRAERADTPARELSPVHQGRRLWAAVSRLISGFVDRWLERRKLFVLHRIDGQGIGDVLCMSALMKRVNELRGDRFIVISKYPALFERNPRVVSNIAFNRLGPLRKPFVKWFVRRISCDRVCCFNYRGGEPVSAEQARADHCRRISLTELFSEHMGICTDYRGLSNEIVLGALECAQFDQELKLPARYAVIKPTGPTGWTPIKEWGSERFQAVVRAMPDLHWIQPGDVCDPLLDGVEDLRGKTSLRQLFFVISRADFVLSVEGVYNHIASAFDVPSFVVLSGLSHPELAKYRTTTFIAREPQVECAPCWLTSPCSVPGKPCTTEIQPAQVVDAIRHQTALRLVTPDGR